MPRTKWWKNARFRRTAISGRAGASGFTGEKARKDCPCLLRRVVAREPINQREIVLPGNLPAFGSATIAAIGKDRREIELFFRALRQNLRVKSFVGASENALRIRIWTAPDRHPAAQMAAPSFKSQMMVVESGFDAAAEPVYPSRLERLAG
jgi:hypothetical protein